MTEITLDRFPLLAAEHHPDLTSFKFGDSHLDYAGLATQAAQLAALLQERGAKRGAKVGICMERSLEAAIAIYGVLHAGAVVVPLDPAAPAARHRNIAERTGMRHFIGHAATAAQIGHMVDATLGESFVYGLPGPGLPGPGLPDAQPVTASLDWGAHLSYSPLAPQNLSEDDTAYVIFTSGSTGVPKGIIHRHRSASAYARITADLYDLGPGKRITNHAPTHFDISTFGLYSGPCAAATTVIVSKSQVLLDASLARMVQDEQITHWYSLTSAMTRVFSLEGIETLDYSALEWALFGGDGISNAQLRRMMQALPNTRFSQSYGPTEVNQCTYHHFDGLTPDDSDHPIIGRMLPEAHGILLDAAGADVAMGQVGELCVCAPTAMASYFGDTPSRDSVFLDRQTPDGRSGSFYRTGDLMRQSEDGLLYFLGRKDRLTKFRGVRLELDEIEAVLSNHPHVGSAAAMLSTDLQDLIAAVILKPGAQISTQDLSDHLATVLPRQIIPTIIVILAEFPLTGSGKTDRIALLKQLERNT